MARFGVWALYILWWRPVFGYVCMNPEYLDMGRSETQHDREYILINKVFYQILGKTMDTVQEHARNSRCSEYGSDMLLVQDL